MKDLGICGLFHEKSPDKKVYWASKGAALLLFSRVYLYMQDWKNAEITAKELLAEDRFVRL